MRRIALALLLSAALACPASANDFFPNATGTQSNPGVVNMFNNGSGQSVPVTATVPMPIAPTAYPSGAVPFTASTTGTTGATTATLTGAAAVTTFICGFSILANATAAATGNATVTGTISGTLNFTQFTAPVASGIGNTSQNFTPCVPASGVNTSIAVVSAAPGSGGVISVTAWGYKL